MNDDPTRARGGRVPEGGEHPEPLDGPALGPDELDEEGNERGADPLKGGILKERPTEVASGLAIAAAVYGFLTQSGVRQDLAALVAIALAFGPLVISNTVSRIRGER